MTHFDNVGFTPFAKAHLLNDVGFARDTKHRVYVMGGRDVHGQRIRREMKGALRPVWVDYAGRWGYTHLWVKWKDGRRRLVHRKGC